MSDRRIYITEATNGWWMEFCRFDEDSQQWVSVPGAMVFQDFDMMVDCLRGHFNSRNLR